MGWEISGGGGNDRIYLSIMKALQMICTYNFEIVKDYTQLGTILTSKNEVEAEI